MTGPWAGVRVVETAGLTGAYATRLWAALGAEVVVVEPPDGHPLRHLPPFATGSAGPESLWWAYFGQGKRSVVAAPGSGALDRIVASADVVIGDVGPGGAEPGRGPRAAHDRQVVVAVSPFGLTGPRRTWRGSELVAWASSGLAHTFGFPDRPPVGVAPAVQFAAHVTSLYAVNAAMLGLRAVRRLRTGGSTYRRAPGHLTEPPPRPA